MPAATSMLTSPDAEVMSVQAGGHRADLDVAAGGAHRDVTGGGPDLDVSRGGLGPEFADIAQAHVARCRVDPDGPADPLGGHIAAGRPDLQRAQLTGAQHVRRGRDELGRRARRDLHGHVERGAAVEAALVGSDHRQHSAVELDAGGREEFLAPAACGAGHQGHRGGFGGQRGHGDVSGWDINMQSNRIRGGEVPGCHRKSPFSGAAFGSGAALGRRSASAAGWPAVPVSFGRSR